MKGFAFAIALVAALAFSAAAARFGVTAGTEQQTPPAQGMPGKPGMADMQGMMKMHEQMMAEMTAGDAKLDTLVQAMNSATGAGKVDAMASVVAELVQQQKAMHTHMGQMHQQMMGGRGMMMK
jgi:hypothetical protein